MNWFRGSWAVLQKDLRLEMRSRYALNMLLMFVLSSLLLIAFSVGKEAVSERMQTALLWIVILFSASIGLGRSFVAEEEQGTVLLLQLNVPGSQVFAGKLIFNLILLLAVDVVGLGVFAILLNMPIENWGLLALTLLLGSVALAGATTLLAAIIARATNKGPLLPVLLFPLLVPLLLSVVRASRSALDGGLGFPGATEDLQTIALFAGVVITAAVLLFDYVWTD
ncbi:MAG: heme exporter protein CcmB [Bacteroidetes bacterium]|nr:heme exporter protein CcmB [Bacteroidota bacterium]MDA1334252.1 heme exporter protein CcmB [Bacteroidota bacterium]